MEEPSFFEVVHSPYYICIGNYSEKVAGIRALYYLCHVLNGQGQEAYILGADADVTHLRAPRLQLKDFVRHQQGKHIPIMVYPEVLSGNPYKMPHVVRWLLNKAGHLGGDESFHETEMVYAYSPDYIPDGQDLPLLSIPIVDHSIFNNRENQHDHQRQGRVYYAHKYLANGHELTEHVNGAKSLCQDVKVTQEEMANILRSSELLYCYEPSSIIGEALICGCPVVVIPTSYTEENLTYPIYGEGIASTPSDKDIAYAKSTISLAQDNIVAFHGHCWHHLRNFIDVTQTESATREEGLSHSEKAWGDEIFKILNQSSTISSAKVGALSMFKNKHWLRNNFITEGRVSVMAEGMVNSWKKHPSFHLIMVINADELDLLSETINTLEYQLYKTWGLTILSYQSAPEIFKEVPENIEWLQIEADINESIEQAVNDAGLDWVMQILPGDKLTPHALLSFAESINLYDKAQMIYCDEIVDENRYEIWFKPAFNLELLRSQSYLGQAIAVSRVAFEATEGYSSFAYVGITDMAFKVVEHYGVQAIQHVPDVLLTSHPHSVNEDTLAANEMIIRQGHFMRSGLKADVWPTSESATFHFLYQQELKPLVSIIIANRNNATTMARCIDELLENLKYENYELIIIDQLSDVEDLDDIYLEAKELCNGKFKLLQREDSSYSSLVNFAVSQAEGRYLAVISSTAVPINGGWLDEMMSQAMRKEVGAVGVRVIDEDDKILHAGGMLGITDDIKGMCSGLKTSDGGYMNRAHSIQECSSVSSACFVVSKDNYLSVGGLDESSFANSRYCVMDLCLKLTELGLKNIWTPYASFFQALKLADSSNGITDFIDNEIIEAELIRRWPTKFKHDPFYNPNLSLKTTNYSVDTDINIGWDARFHDRLRVMAFPFQSSGVGEYRVRSPLRVLSNEALIEAALLPNHEFKTGGYLPTRFELHRASPDVVLFQNILNDDDYTFMKNMRAETDTFMVYGIDDLISQVPKKSDRKKLVFRDMKHRLRKILALCDRVIVSTQPLAEAYAEFHDDIVVIPNTLERQRWLDITVEPYAESNKPRVGWAGAHQHYGDLEVIFDVVKQTAAEYDWVFFGMCPNDLKPYVKEVHEFVSFEKYPEKLASLNLDVALAPLEVNPFNEAKSNLRLLEYGVMGWPVICSDIYPFQQNNPPVVRVENNSQAWELALQDMLSDRKALKSQGAKLKEWVMKNYLLENHIAEWLQALTPSK